MNYIQAKSIVLNHFESLCGQAEQKELQRLLSICNGIQTKAFITDVLTNDFKGFEESCYTWNNIYYSGEKYKRPIIELAKLIIGQSPKHADKMIVSLDYNTDEYTMRLNGLRIDFKGYKYCNDTGAVYLYSASDEIISKISKENTEDFLLQVEAY